MHAFLIVGSDENNLVEFVTSKAKEEQVVQQIPFILQKIDDVRNLKKMTKFSFSEKTAIIINDIDQATNESLNAFLKNLEEPNRNLIYILTAKNLTNVLPTIISRCEVINAKGYKQEISNKTQVTNFISAKLNQKLEIVGKIKERDDAVNFVISLIFVDNNLLRKEIYLKTLNNLKLNGNVGLQLTNLVVRMESHG